MASTYSTNLKIELIGTGEQNGLWGVVTNTNLGTAIEEAITGRATANFTADTDLTITLTNSNASQVARNLYLDVTSDVSLTAGRSLIVPTIEKQYIVRNSTTGGQSITVKTAAGTGVSVANGGTVHLFVDGTNVVPAVTALPAMTAPIQATSTGIAYTFASDTNTGMGNPALENLAFYTDGSEKMRIMQFGSVGIGTTSPNALLHVSGNTGMVMVDSTAGPGFLVFGTGAADGSGAAAGRSWFNGGASTSGAADARLAEIGVYTEGATVNNRGGIYTISTKANGASGIVERFRIDSSGNVGVGKTPVSGLGLLQVNGGIEATSLNGGQLAGLRNKVINGNFDIWQRGVSFTNPNSIYTADRWIGTVGAATAGSATLQAFTPGQTDVPGNPTYFARVQATAATGQTLFSQRVEDVTQFSGVTVTLSFWAKSDATTVLQAGYPQLRQNFGTGGSTEVAYNNTGDAVTLTTSWQKITRTYNLASVAGKTIGANNSLVVLPVRLDGAVVTFDLAQVQLEYGSVATPFEQRPLALELLLCQRYYYRRTIGSSNAALANGICISTTQAFCETTFPVPMRVAPSAIEQTGVAGDYTVRSASSSIACSAVPTYSSTSIYSALAVYTVASGLNTGDGALVRSSAATTPFLGWSAEL